MVHTVSFRVASADALDVLGGAPGRRGRSRRGATATACGSRIPRASASSSSSSTVDDEPLVARHPEIPAEHALQGFDGVRAFARRPRGEPRAARGRARLRADRRGHVGGARRRRAAACYAYDAPPAPEPGIPGAGTVHHVAWASHDEDHEAWQRRVTEAGRARDARDRPLLVPLDLLPRAERRAVRDRDARPRGSAIDEDPEHLGEALILPPAFEHLRGEGRAGADAAAEPRGPTGRDASSSLAGASPRRRARRRARPPPRPRRGRARPLPAARPPRPRAPAPRRHPGRPARRCRPGGGTGTRSAGSRRPSRRPSTRPRRCSPPSSTPCRCRRSASCSAASRRAR